MFGLVVLGMILGAALAGAFVSMGGSLLLGVAVFSLVGTTVTLGTAMLFFAMSRKRGMADSDRASDWMYAE